MNLTESSLKILNKEIEAEVDRQIKNYPVHVKICGVEVDAYVIIAGGEVEVHVTTPINWHGEI